MARNSWILFGGLFLFHAAVGVASPLLPRLRHALLASYSQIGWVNAAFGVTRLLTAVPAGWMLRRRSPTMLVFLGMGVVVCGNLLSASAGSAYGVIVGRAIAGFGYGPAVVGTLTLLAGFATQASRARMFSFYEFLSIAGLAASTALTGFVVEWMGWRAGFVLGAALALAGLGATLVSLGGERLIGTPPCSPGLPDTRPGERLTSRIEVWPVGFVLFTSFVLSYTWTGHFYTLYPLYGGEQLGLGTASVGVAMSVGYLTDLAFLFPYGWLADRYGRVHVLLGGVLLVALAAFALPLSSSGSSYLAIGGLTGLGFACWGLPPALLTDWVPPGSRGMVLGLYRFMIDLGYILGPWTASAVLEGEGFRMAAWMVAALSGVGLLAFYGLRLHSSSTARGIKAELNE